MLWRTQSSAHLKAVRLKRYPSEGSSRYIITNNNFGETRYLLVCLDETRREEEKSIHLYEDGVEEFRVVARSHSSSTEYRANSQHTSDYIPIKATVYSVNYIIRFIIALKTKLYQKSRLHLCAPCILHVAVKFICHCSLPTIDSTLLSVQIPGVQKLFFYVLVYYSNSYFSNKCYSGL